MAAALLQRHGVLRAGGMLVEGQRLQPTHARSEARPYSAGPRHISCRACYLTYIVWKRDLAGAS